MSVRWEPEWSPDWAQHVIGRFTHREYDPMTGLPEPQKVEIKCSVCGAEWKLECSSGHVRDHVNRFAGVHLHRDPLDAPRVVGKGSVRRG